MRHVACDVAGTMNATAAPPAILFLDIDKVLNDDAFIKAALVGHETIVRWSMELAARTLDPARVARVQRICDTTGASIVIVSGWRRYAPVEAIIAVLCNANLIAPVLGAVGGRKMNHDLRMSATREWLDAHPEVTRWCVLDDDLESWRESRTTTVQEARRTLVNHERVTPTWLEGHAVHPVDGITDEDVAKVVAILGERPTRAVAPDVAPFTAPHVNATVQAFGGAIRLRSASGGLEALWIDLLDDEGSAVVFDKATGRHMQPAVRITPDNARDFAAVLTAYADSHAETE